MYTVDRDKALPAQTYVMVHSRASPLACHPPGPWVFCEPRDDAFIETHPRIVRAQEQQWRDHLRRAQHRYTDGVFGTAEAGDTRDSLDVRGGAPGVRGSRAGIGAAESGTDVHPGCNGAKSEGNSDGALAAVPDLTDNGQPKPLNDQVTLLDTDNSLSRTNCKHLCIR